MNRLGLHGKCQSGDGCVGPGCRVTTGKTRTKNNAARPKPNQHEASRASATTKKGKS